MTTPTHTQLLIIGAGPGGYVAAFLAADLGLEVTLVDMENNPGGVCLFRGCIPSKALLHVAKLLGDAKEAKELGIDFGDPKININKIREWKKGVVSKLTGGLGQLCKQRRINLIQGRATFLDSDTVQVKKFDKTELHLSFDNLLLATGSFPMALPFAPASPRILNSRSALNLDAIPKKLLVIGGGYIGLEIGSVYCELGSEVSVVEMTSTLLPGADRDLVNVLGKRLAKKFASIKLSTKGTKLEDSPEGMVVTFEDKDGKTSTADYDKALISIGRKPNSANLGFEKTKIELTEKGFVKVNPQRQTTDPKIYAIGDVAGQPMLAHKASHEGRVAVEAITGKKVAFEPKAIPAVIFTDPEIAWCGLSETEAKTQNKTIKVAKFPWAASGRALTLNRPEGLTKLIIDPATERVLGVGIAGPGAGDLIAEGVLAVEMGAIAADIQFSIHPHPTLSETIMEAAENFYGLSPHIYRPKKSS